MWCKNDEEPKVHYFTSRIEIGTQQQRDRMRLLHDFLECPSDQKHHYINNLQEARNLGLMGTLNEREAFGVRVECRVMDQMGKMHTIDRPMES